MPETIAILGANGVYARHLIPRLVAANHTVIALARRPEAATVALANKCEVRQADIFDTQSMATALKDCTTGINLATSLPGPSGRGDWDANDKLRSQGTPNWVTACTTAGVARIIQQSIGMVSANGPDWSDEDASYNGPTDTTAGKAIAASLAMESAVTSSALDWLILRGGLFYGPGTGFDDGWRARAQAGKLRLPEDGSDYVSLVHIADMAAATANAINNWPSRQTLIVTDDEPAPWIDVFTYLTTLAGQPAPQPGGAQGFPSFRLKNTRAKAALNWRPAYASWRQGLIT